LSKELTSEAYSKSARNYEKKWAEYLDHTHSVLLSDFKSGPESEILDVSAGTGLFAEHLIEGEHEFNTLTLNDVSAGMLKLAKQRLDERGDVNFSCAYVEELGFDTSAFDIVISMNAFHNYAEQDKALEQMQRVLKPGGYLYLLDWNRSGFFRLINYGIKVVVPEIINTRSAGETRKMLKEKNFQIEKERKWKYKYWQFYLFKALKK
jgi:ubiquinone/menaquinone biosynthesis C-methylase UbiE